MRRGSRQERTRYADVTIDSIAAGGEGVGRLDDGRVVFVHRTAPGDRVKVRLLEAKKRWARAEVVQWHERGPDVRSAPCPYYERCGGCTLEHLTYEAQLHAKSRIVAETLRRIGGIEIAPPDVVPSRVEFRYRNRVSFTLHRGGGRVIAGFHELRRPERVLDIGGACLLPEEPIAAAWAALRAAWGESASLLPSGETLRLTLRSTADGVLSLLIEGGYGPGRGDEIIARVPAIASIWHRPTPESPFTILAGRENLTEGWNGEEVALAGGIFLQVNRQVAEALEDHVMALAGDVDGARVIDAYCGVGLYARRLQRAGASVTGIEWDVRAVAEAERASPGTRLIAGPVESCIRPLLPADLVILNPPRAGLEAAVCDALNAQPAGRLIYVSCDPATLARDIARLEAWHARSVRCFDLFPQTSHVETVVELACAGS